MYVCTCTHTHVHTYMYVHVHIHMYIYMCVCFLLQEKGIDAKDDILELDEEIKFSKIQTPIDNSNVQALILISDHKSNIVYIIIVMR